MRYSLILLFLIASFSAAAQQLIRPTGANVPLKELQRREDSLSAISHRQATNRPAAKTTASNFDTSTFVARINSNWGVGLSIAQKLDVFDTYWGQVDSFYGSFTGLPMYNWDSIINAMRTEISGGVSKGRFAGIIGELSRYINDGHSYFTDYDLYTTGALFWGSPLLYGGNSGGYGACLTTLDDSVAMVYESRPGNVLNLQPGDKILGYNGIPWKELIPILLHYNMPMVARVYSTDSATWHRYISSVLNNFLMFDTVNIQKCDGSLVNFPTTVMTSAYMGDYFCTEQMTVPGVQKMTYTDYFTNNKMVTSGVITGTNIGYVALYDCGDMSGDSLKRPIKRLIEENLVDGLIIDIRTNFGGSLLTYSDAFNYLYEGDFPWMGWADRLTVSNRYAMNPFVAPPSAYHLPDTIPHFFDKKIALLVGPGAISAGDVMQILFTHHPKLKMIGKPTAGAFGAIVSIPLPATGYYGARQTGDFYRAEENDFYLSHHNFPIDSFVWFDQASVCAGTDKILETAVNWINAGLSVTEIQGGRTMVKVFPNPSEGVFNVLLEAPAATTATISLLTVTGAIVGQTSAAISTGENKLRVDFTNRNLPTGTYQMVIRGNGLETVVRKVTIVR